MHKTEIIKEANRKKQLIYRKDLEDATILANQQPETTTFYNLEEIAVLVEDLMGLDAPRDEEGRILEVRPKGHWFEFEVGKRLGYNYPPAAGLFPDIRHQVLEVKHHTGRSVTVGFGLYHPGSDEVINETWNRELRLRVNQIRYLIALAPPPECRIVTIIVLTGAQIMSVFDVSRKPTIKYQTGIPKRWREEHRGKLLVGESVWDIS